MILHSFQLPAIITKAVTERKPISIGRGDRQFKDQIINMISMSGLYEDRYNVDKESANIYLNMVDEDAMSSTNAYPVSSVARLVGIEPNIMYPYDMAHLNASPIIRINTGNGKRSTLIIMGNAFLRNNFSLNSIITIDRLTEIFTNYDLSSGFPYDSIFSNAGTFINISRNLSTLYRDLMVETSEDGFLDVLSTKLDDHRPALDKTGNWFYMNNMTYVVTALTIATMRLIYNAVTVHSPTVQSPQFKRIRNGIVVNEEKSEFDFDSAIALALIDNTFKSLNVGTFFRDLKEDINVVKKLVDVLIDDNVTNGSKSFMTIATELTYGISSVERSIK